MIAKEKVTCIGVVPTHIIRMLETDLSRYDLSSLRFIRSAGGYLPPQVAMEAEENIGLMLPCNVIVYEKDKKVIIAAIKPTVAMQMIDNPKLNKIAAKVETEIEKVLDKTG